MLEDKIAYYKENGKMLNNTPAQYKKEYEWLKDVDSLALANSTAKLRKHVTLLRCFFIFQAVS